MAGLQIELHFETYISYHRFMSKKSPICPLAHALDQVGDRWTFLILRNAFLGKRRFSDFIESLGIARNILTTRLNAMVENGLFEIRPSKEDGRVSEYRLTPKAKELSAALLALRLWAEKWHPDYDFLGEMIEKDTGKKIKDIRFRTKDNTVVAPEDVRLEYSDETNF